MKRLTTAFMRLWKIATCNHRNFCVEFRHGVSEDCPDGTSRLCVCRKCGVVISVGSDGYRQNDHETYMARK